MKGVKWFFLAFFTVFVSGYAGTASVQFSVAVSVEKSYTQFKNKYNQTLSEIKQQLKQIEGEKESFNAGQAVADYSQFEEGLYKKKIETARYYEKFKETALKFLENKKADRKLLNHITEEFSTNQTKLEELFDSLIRYANLKRELSELLSSEGVSYTGDSVEFEKEEDLSRYKQLISEIKSTIRHIEEISTSFQQKNRKILEEINAVSRK
ncbi:hypothetical protein [Persephonella sp.]